MENIIDRCIQYFFDLLISLNAKNANLGDDYTANNEFKQELISLIFD